MIRWLWRHLLCPIGLHRRERWVCPPWCSYAVLGLPHWKPCPYCEDGDNSPDERLVRDDEWLRTWNAAGERTDA